MADNTINNLQEALRCAGKCDCCEKLQNQINVLDSKLSTISNKVNALNQDIKNIIPKVNNHERRIANNEKFINRFNNTNSNNNSNRDINKIKQQILAIERYINALDKAGVSINNALKGIFKIFKVFK